MKEMVYAPVIIATLNREKHLRHCVESLGRCKYARETELFISVDYPKYDKYVEGYNRVCTYLKGGITGFKEVHICYQEKNLGPVNNFRFLQQWVSEKFDRWILSEDDNEFSYNFLEFMDKGLIKFEKDDKVLNICALQDKGPWDIEGENAIYQKNCPAYGLGCWKYKEVCMDDIMTDYLLFEVGKNTEKIRYLQQTSKLFYQQYIEGILCGKNPIFWTDDNKIELSDTVRTIYAICADKYFVAPKVSKARNWGNDGSGVNMKKKKIDPCEVWKLDESQSFEYDITFNNEKVAKYNKYIHQKMYKISLLYVVKAKLKYLFYSLKS